MFECPHCHERGIGFLQKLFMGSTNPARCKRCGRRVAISQLSVILLIPTYVMMFFLFKVDDSWLRILLLGLLIVVFFYIHLKYSKLIPI